MEDIRFEEIFNLLKKSFLKRYNKSDDKVTLLKSEIDSHEMLFGYKKLPAFIDPLTSYRPLKNLVYNINEIQRIREAYEKYIVNGADINESGILYNYKNTLVRHEPNPVKLHYFIEAKVRFLYLKWLREYNSNNTDIEKLNYVLKNESVIVKLFEQYGNYFPDETKKLWKSRWINGIDTLPKIKIDKFKVGNNKHLLLTIINEAFTFIKLTKKENYIKTRWGLKSYHSDISKYLNSRDAKPHPESENIREILKSEQN